MVITIVYKCEVINLPVHNNELSIPAPRGILLRTQFLLLLHFKCLVVTNAKLLYHHLLCGNVCGHYLDTNHLNHI